MKYSKSLEKLLGYLQEVQQEYSIVKMAERYNYEKDWGIARFRECFTHATKEIRD